MSVAVEQSTNPGIAPARSATDHRPYPIREPFTVRDLLTAVFYHRKLMLVALTAPILFGIAAASIARPAFVAQARLLVLYGSEYFYQPVATQAGNGVALDRNEIMQGELQILQSTTLALATLRTVGVSLVYPGIRTDDQQALDRAVLRFSRDLTVSTIPQSSVLELSFRSYDPDVAANVLRAQISGYLERRATIFQRATTTAAQADQAVFRDRLKRAEDALARFAEAHGISNVDQQINLLVQQQSANSQARNDVAQAIGETSASLAAISEQLARLPQTLQTYADSERSQSARVLTESLARLQVKRRDIASRYLEDSPVLQDVDRQIAALQADIAQQPARENAVERRGVNPVYQAAQAQQVTLTTQLAGLRARSTQLAATAAIIDAQISDLNRSARDYRDLLRDRDLLDESYRSLDRSYAAAEIGDTAERSRTANIRVVQPPERPAVGTSLRKILVAGGILVGALAALTALAVANALKQVFVTPRDVTVGLDLPVVLTVPGPRRTGFPMKRCLAEASAQFADRPSEGISPQTMTSKGMSGA